MRIRLSDAKDLQQIGEVDRAAFGDGEGETIVELTTAFLTEPGGFEIISLVAEDKGRVVGHVIFSEVRIQGDAGKTFILAPLAVLPACQKGGIGAALVRDGLERVSAQGTEFVIVYGDPAYYSRFGFRKEGSEQFVPPYELQLPHGWQHLVLNQSPPPDVPAHLTCAPPLRKPELW